MAFRRVTEGQDDLWIMDADGGNQLQVTDDTLTEQSPTWSPDGSRLAMGTSGLAAGGIHVMNANGSDRHGITPGPPGEFSPAWSPRP